MTTYDKYLYDDIGNKYERKNTYILELIDLEDKCHRAKDQDKKKWKTKINQHIKNKDNHAFIQAHRAFISKEKSFLKQTRETMKVEKSRLKRTFSKYIVQLKLNLLQVQEEIKFYSDYSSLSYDAELKVEAGGIKAQQLEILIDQIDGHEKELKASLVRLDQVKKENHDKDLSSFKTFKDEQKKIYAHKMKALKQKKEEGLISTKALVNGKAEYKAAYKEAVTVRSFDLKVKGAKEKVKTLSYQLKKDFKKELDVLESNIADLRRKTPVESTKRHVRNAYLTFAFPGLGQILNGQKRKGMYFLVLSLFVYMIAIPYALGFGNYQGQGLAGLVSLAEGGLKLERSLFFMIEGIIAIFLILLSIIGLFVAFKDVYTVEKSALKGIRQRNWFESKHYLQEEGFPYLVSLPALIAVVFIVLVPITTAVMLSFTNMNPSHQNKFNWVGLENYKMIAMGEGVAGGAFWNILGWTVVWTLISTTLAIVVGFGLAIISNNERIKGKTFFRAVYLLPWAVPAFITIMFFSIMFSSKGILTQGIQDLFNLDEKLIVKNSALWSRVTLIGIQTWLGSAYIFLLSTGVLQGIPSDLYEAAQIDGASTWQKLRKITLPIVLFQTAPLLVGQYTFNFNNFSIIYLFNGGGPFNPTKYGNLAGSTDLLISYIYKLTMDNSYQAIGAAITVVIAMGLMIFAFIGFKNSKAFKEEKL